MWSCALEDPPAEVGGYEESKQRGSAWGELIRQRFIVPFSFFCLKSTGGCWVGRIFGLRGLSHSYRIAGYLVQPSTLFMNAFWITVFWLKSSSDPEHPTLRSNPSLPGCSNSCRIPLLIQKTSLMLVSVVLTSAMPWGLVSLLTWKWVWSTKPGWILVPPPRMLWLAVSPFLHWGILTAKNNNRIIFHCPQGSYNSLIRVREGIWKELFHIVKALVTIPFLFNADSVGSSQFSSQVSISLHCSQMTANHLT